MGFLMLLLLAELPSTPREPVEDHYHGVTVRDEYRWLESGKNERVRTWTRAQDAAAREHFQRIPSRAKLKEELGKIVRSVSVSYFSLRPSPAGVFAVRFDPAYQQPMLVLMRSPDEPQTARTILDPNALDEKKLISMDWYEPSPDGKRVAISLSRAGSESGDVHVYDVASGRTIEPVIPRVNGGTAGGSLAWTADGKGFFYTRYPHEGERPKVDLDFYQQVWHHTLGEPVAKDRYELGKDSSRIAEWLIEVDDASGFALATMQLGDSGEFQHHLRLASGEWRQLTTYADHVVDTAFGPRGTLYLISRKDAPKGKILRLALPAGRIGNARVVVPEGNDTLISLFGESHMVVTQSRLYATYQLGGPSELRSFGLDGKPLAKPDQFEVGSADSLVAFGDGVLFRVQSYVSAPEFPKHDAKTGKTGATALRVQLPVRFDDCEVMREFAVSKDGTKVPVNIIRRKGVPLDGRNPALLTGYGGFGISLSPAVSATIRPLLDRGFVFAIANLRGGSEYGQKWQDEGRLTRKQNVFDDFAAAMQHLIARGYTSPGKLAIRGGSNGGLLVGAALTQHPELCRAAVAEVGIHDMLRNELTPNGAFNTVEYGTVKEKDQFDALYAYSPYHHVKDKVRYPAVMLTTGENDPRVDPLHSRKMAARLQAATASGLPVLLRVDFEGGHGGGQPIEKVIELQADVFSFVVEQVGVR